MKIVSFSVTNYRSITAAHKINLHNLTVLIGKNNEGKSNLLTALNVAMKAMKKYAILRNPSIRSREYDWSRDFPLQLQGRKSGLESIFRLNFRLEHNEKVEFKSETGIKGNEDIPISIKVGKDNIIKIDVPKRGSSAYNKKSKQISQFISKRISFNYIQAVRTDDMALDELKEVIYSQLQELDENEDYRLAIEKVSSLQQEVLDNIASSLLEPLHVFLPQLRTINIRIKSEDTVSEEACNDIDIVIDDGVPTSISYKGDGIKSLVTLAILKDKRSSKAASIIAIEEPESHLHSGAIHNLIDVIYKISVNNQVIITTHNPLFVQQNHIEANIIVNNRTARQAKSIPEIREILGVLPSDNLRNARHVFVVEGDDDKISLLKILHAKSEKLASAFKSNLLIIKPLGGVGNLSHDLADLKNSMCKYFVLLDYDRAGIESAEKAIAKGLLKEAEIKHTICNGSPQAEFEDCINKDVYFQTILDKFSVNINSSTFNGNEIWSERMKKTFLSQGARWTDEIKQKVKLAVAESIPDDITGVLIEQKSGFLTGVVASLERLLDDNIN